MVAEARPLALGAGALDLNSLVEGGGMAGEAEELTLEEARQLAGELQELAARLNVKLESANLPGLVARDEALQEAVA